MVGTSTRSSYKRKRKGTFSGRQRYKKDEALNVSNSSTRQTSQTDEVDAQNIVGTSRKKMRADSKNAGSEFTIESPQNCQEYRVISLNCLSTAVSSMQHVCGAGKIPFKIFYVFNALNIF
jgi:hypothetical protein